jgi:proteic killer suppression protein
MPDIFTVCWGKKVAKQLDRIPSYIAKKFYAWVTSVEVIGIIKTRQSPSFHDEPLKGELNLYRSVRLNKSYRVIYKEAIYKHTNTKEITIIEVVKVTNHEY